MATELHIKPEPDGLGFLYGTLIDAEGTHHRIDIMPPLPHWRGDFKLTGEGSPHATDWVAFVDGEEIARVRVRDNLEAAITERLAAG